MAVLCQLLPRLVRRNHPYISCKCCVEHLCKTHTARSKEHDAVMEDLQRAQPLAGWNECLSFYMGSMIIVMSDLFTLVCMIACMLLNHAQVSLP
jgi:hypothetical protein